MAYATPEDYDRYGDGVIPVEQLEKALDRASDQIDRLTYNRIVACGFDNLTPFQQLNVTKATCQQADFVYKYGDYLTMPLSGYSAGSTSMTFKAATGAGGVQTSDAVLDLLLPTGLTDRRLR
ncbi:hypothetical protein QNH46_07865 [Paenibacillus woosongensis]|uniref:Uncharacterized protein n=1 Tax=Paenibacillus woosongensis TaxID=307580 RepID=A0AA95I7C7_9BACL|nr:hypothetical protein [Paenibacillus woosongensis]WHX50551.1 hypothetical protein QNH46_07865 [Paenibacillus woosongensis]